MTNAIVLMANLIGDKPSDTLVYVVDNVIQAIGDKWTLPEQYGSENDPVTKVVTKVVEILEEHRSSTDKTFQDVAEAAGFLEQALS